MGYKNESLGLALEHWRRVLGHEHVLADQADRQWYGRTTVAGKGALPGAIVRPKSVDQVQEVVKVAGHHGIALYPISRGKNWGYGDACAPSAGQVIVDLGRMDRIIEVNDGLAYAVIEPGVTQGQLYDHLAAKHPGLWMDCTGAGPDASIVGNILDRGFGHTRYGDRGKATCGMQVVLADGRLLETGFGSYPQRGVGHVYPYGVGPGLDGLFCQSNFGVVTRVGIWLMPKPQKFCAYFFSAKDKKDITDLVDRLSPLKRGGVLNSAIHIANDLRVISSRIRYPYDLAKGQTPLPDDIRMQLRPRWKVQSWNGLGAVYGTKGAVNSAVKEIKRALVKHRVRFVNDYRLNCAKVVAGGLGMIGLGHGIREMIGLIEPMYGLLHGRPTREPLAGMGWRVRDPGLPEAVDPLDTNAGFMWVSPVLPMVGREAAKLLGLIQPIYEKHGFEVLVTFTMISERAMVCVTNLSFDKRDEQEAENARVCYEELMSAVLGAGYPPYRVGLDGYEKMWRYGGTYWDVASKLKRALDPAGVISPGRYVPPN